MGRSLKRKSKQELDRFLKGRIVEHQQFKKYQFHTQQKILPLNKELIENKNTKSIDKILKGKSLLSVFYFDGQNVIVDKKSEKIQDDTKLYSFSISKSFVSYILGNTICNGDIKSLDDKISDYVPETKGTLYENSTFKDLINMKAGDTNFASRKQVLQHSFMLVRLFKKDSKGYLAESSNLKTTKKYLIIITSLPI